MKFRDQYWFLSNMYPCSIFYRGTTWKSAEHLFQASKTTHITQRDWIAQSQNASEAKRRGRLVTLRDNWNTIRVPVMREVVTLKFSQNAYLLEKLRKIDGTIVEDNTWGDKFWGKCNGQGENHLGIILMAVRDYLV
jgi:ribA/ribD-fused uncharacterized protein